LSASVLMLEFVGLNSYAERLQTAIQAVLANGPYTPDLAGAATTAEVVQAVIDQF